MITNPRTIILANKRSRGYRDVYRRHLLNIFAKRRKAPVYYVNHTNGDLFAPLKEQIKSAQHVIIAGGDGTFESALNSLLFHKKSLGFFPLGKGNAFYSYFYRGKRFEYLRSHFQFQETKQDVLQLEWNGKKIQTLFCSIGLDAEVIRFSKDRSHYFLAIWRAILHAKARFPLQVTADDKIYTFNNCINLTLGKVPYYGYGVRSLISPVLPANNVVYGLACLGGMPIFNKFLRLVALLFNSLNLSMSPLFPLKGYTFIVHSPVPFPLQAGGEFLGFTDAVKIRVLRTQSVLTI